MYNLTIGTNITLQSIQLQFLLIVFRFSVKSIHSTNRKKSEVQYYANIIVSNLKIIITHLNKNVEWESKKF